MFVRALFAQALRPLLGLVLVVPMVLFGVLATSAPASACSCKASTFKQQVARADTVFVASVVSVGTPSGNDLTYDVLARRVFKGEMATANVQVTTAASPSSCGVGPMEPGQMWLFLTLGGTTSSCQGSAPASTDVMERAQKLLGIGTRLDPPPPTEATRTPVETAPPLEFTRLAAPGAALVLLGLLGLAVVVRIGRPH